MNQRLQKMQTLVIEELPTDPAEVALQESIFEAIMALEAMESDIPVATAQRNGEAQGIAVQQNETQPIQSTAQTSILGQEAIETIEQQASSGEPQTPQIFETAVSDAQLNLETSQNNNDVQDYQVQDIADDIHAVSDTDYQFHEQLLLELPNDSYVLQLSGITTEGLLEEYLVDNRMLNSVWVYKTQRYGGDWFVVLFNQSFDSLEAARSGVSLLSTQLQSVSPFAKSVSQIKNEILSD